MKKISLILAVLLIVGLFTGCAGTTVVYYSDCTCPAGSHTPPATNPPVLTQGALKTGLYISTGIGDSKSAAGDENGEAKYDVTMVAVLVDDKGVIQDCIIDGIAASVKFDASGAITSDLTAPVQTKNELGDKYGMVAWGGAIAEWDEQAAALARYAVGKTVDELKNGAIDETGKAPAGSDLASSATIYLGGFVAGIEKAVANAQYLGAETGDTLKLSIQSKISDSVSAGEKAGTAQLDTDIAVLTARGDVISSCIIDSVQAKITFDASGKITTDLSKPLLTKNELGENYGMAAWGSAIAEWNVQAAAFAQYVTGKTAAEVAGISVNEGTKPSEGTDLSASVTIAIGGFQALIAKAFA